MTQNSGKNNEPFVTGPTVQKRAENLYIWEKLGPQKVAEFLNKHGDKVTARQVRRWITEGGWYEKRKKFHACYDKQKIKEQAKQRANRDVTREERLRERINSVGEMLIDEIEKSIISFRNLKEEQIQGIPYKLKEISHALKNTKEILWSTNQIPDEKIVDPTTRYEGITIITDQNEIPDKGEMDE